MPQLYVYSKNGCGFCDKLTEFLDKKGFSYNKFILGEDFTVDQFLDKFGQGSTFPQTCVNHESVGGMRDTIKYLVEHNYVK
ncbi:glutaredoxin [Synechococcus phage S-CRM01]|uniref:glutaredoxin n=1 Tax=Synechococcus phage S-CRM01 TaxID=1026955 RepID=UPI000209E392|nr:glutaredoxin [Synechococcus phage S-CRM01]AEC53032.1 glutaredoxin [Synechococcus phage S-CRM01]